MTPTGNVSERSMTPADALPRARDAEGEIVGGVEGMGSVTFGELLSSIQSQHDKSDAAETPDGPGQVEHSTASGDIGSLLAAALTVRDASVSGNVEIDRPTVQHGSELAALALAGRDLTTVGATGESKVPSGAPPAVTVVRQEAHFETFSVTPTPPAPIQQVVERIAAELDRAKSDGGSSGANAPLGDVRQQKVDIAALNKGAPEAESDSPLVPHLIVEARRGKDPDGSASRDASSRGDQPLPADRPVQKIGSGHEQKAFEAAAPAMRPELVTDGTASPPKQTASGIPVAPAAASLGATVQNSGLTRVLPGGGVMKVLQIQLQPAELGMVTVRMSLKDDVLNLQIEAGRHETARLLQKDPEVLTGLLRSAGYQVDGLSVRMAGQDNAPTATGSGQPFIGSSAQSHAGSAQSDARSSHGHTQAQSDADHKQSGRSTNEDESTLHRRNGNGLYV